MTPVATQKPEIDLVSEGWAEYWENPVRFVGDFFGVTPEPYQADILDAVAEFPSVAVRSGHGVGKTAIASWAAPWFLVTRPMSRVMTTAPTFQKQVRDLLWAEIHKWIRRSPLASELNRSKVRLSIPGFDEEWFAVGVAASSPENMEGPHADYLFYVIDEAKGVPDDIFEGIAGTQTTEAKQLLISTPGAQLGHFHRVFTKLRTTWKTFHVPSVGRWGAPRSGDGDGTTASVAESAVADTAKDSIPRKAIGWNEPDAPPISFPYPSGMGRRPDRGLGRGLPGLSGARPGRVPRRGRGHADRPVVHRGGRGARGHRRRPADPPDGRRRCRPVRPGLHGLHRRRLLSRGDTPRRFRRIRLRRTRQKIWICDTAKAVSPTRRRPEATGSLLLCGR